MTETKDDVPTEELADGEVHVEEGQSLEEIKAKLKPKKPKIDAIKKLINQLDKLDKSVLKEVEVDASNHS